MREAYRICRETGVAFAGAWMLGPHASLTQDPRVRDDVLAEGERVLREERCLAHNHIFFYELAIEVRLRERKLDDVRRYCDALENFMQREPTPLTDLVIERGRALSRFLEGDRDPTLISQLKQMSERARSFGFDRATGALDQFLQEI